MGFPSSRLISKSSKLEIPEWADQDPSSCFSLIVQAPALGFACALLPVMASIANPKRTYILVRIVFIPDNIQPSSQPVPF